MSETPYVIRRGPDYCCGKSNCICPQAEKLSQKSIIWSDPDGAEGAEIGVGVAFREGIDDESAVDHVLVSACAGWLEKRNNPTEGEIDE